MSAQAKVPVCQRIISPIDQGLRAQEIASRFRHLRLLEEQKMTMHPKVGETCPVASLGLGDFICVVNRNMIFAAAMNVKKSTQVLGRHGGTFDVPSGKTDTPWAIPLHLALLIGRAKLPQSKVCRVALFALVNARSGPQAARI